MYHGFFDNLPERTIAHDLRTAATSRCTSAGSSKSKASCYQRRRILVGAFAAARY